MIYLRSATPKASVATCRALGGHLSGIQQAGVHTGNVRKSARSSRVSHDRTTRTAALGQRRDSSPEYLRFRGVARPTARRGRTLDREITLTSKLPTGKSACGMIDDTAALSLFRTALPYVGKNTLNISSLSPKRDWGS